MSAWLHWIEYNTIAQFQKEAERQGISRFVSLRELKQMRWMDTVSCVQNESGLRSGSIFLRFPVQMLTGLTQAAQKRMAEKFNSVPVDFGGAIVHRESGEYITGLTYQITAPLADIAKELDFLKLEDVVIGEPMIGCYADRVMSVEKPYPILKDIPFRLGFRTYDIEAARTVIDEYRAKGKRPQLKGQLYVVTPMKEQAGAGSVEEAVQKLQQQGDIQALLHYRKVT